MANALSQLIPRRSFGFAGAEGEAFDYANQPQNMLANLITNESIQGIRPQNYMQRTGGNMVDLGPSQPMNNLRGSPVDVFGQGRGFMQPDGTIVGVNQQGQRFRVQPEGTAEMQQAARDAALKRRLLMANVQQEEAKLQGGGVLSPADQLAREKFEWEKAQGKPQDKAQTERVQTATDALDLIQQAKGIFDAGKATESWIGKARDVGAGIFGASTEGAQASAQLKALGGALVAKMPKMSGPQSDKDVQLYREMAGQIADETVPIETRRAALDTVEQIQRKYAGQDAATQQSAPSGIPKTGHVQDGYIFLGGDPADPKRWRKQ